MDDAREAFMHATAGDWRAYPAYIDRVLDEALDARRAVDAADLERLYRAPAASCSPFVAHHDIGAEWSVP